MIAQVTQGGVTGSDLVTYKFTDTLATTPNNINPSGYTLSVTGTSSAHPGVTTGASIQVETTGCASGYTLSTTTIASGQVKLYTGDLNCKVKLKSFTLGAQAYVPTGVGAVDFTTWLAGDIATFRGASSSDLLRVTVGTQVTQGGVAPADTISYTYSDLITCTGGGTFAAGAGTSTDPYQVANRTDLENVGLCTSSTAYFIQTANIDLTGSLDPWTPIALNGQYNGNSKTISNLYVNDTTGAAVGLFSSMNTGSSASNLTLSSINLTGGQNIGGLAASVVAATVSNCSVSGTVTAQSIATGSGLNAGGLIGLMSNGGTVSNSSSSVNLTFVPSTVSGSNWHGVGGLIGHTGSSATLATTITNSYATGNVTSSSGTTSSDNVGLGGLIGYTTANASTSVTITKSYSTGNQTHSVVGATTSDVLGIGGILGLMLNTTTTNLFVSQSWASGTLTIASTTTSNIQIGGVIGARDTGSVGTAAISDSYSFATISVTGTAAASVGGAGGFIGNVGSSTVSRSYSASPSVSGSGMRATALYGFYGTGTGTFTTSYYYDNAGVATQPATTGLTARTTVTQMQTQSNYAFGNFGSVWRMPSANPFAPSSLLSPVLAWQCGVSGVTCADVTSTCTGSPTFSGGDGTSGFPYEITTRAQVTSVGSCTASTYYFIVKNNINFGGSGTPWTPVALSGQFNGANYTFSNIYVNTTGNVGLFTTMQSGASVSNLNLTSMSLTGNSNIGGLAGVTTSGNTITNVSTSGTISATATAGGATIGLGGLVGQAINVNVTSSSSSANITFTSSTSTGTSDICMGGLLGSLDAAATSVTVSSSFATGDLTSTDGSNASTPFSAGGLVGCATSGTVVGRSATITESYATGDQTHSFNPTVNTNDAGIGGIVGTVLNGDFVTISKVFAGGVYTVQSTNLSDTSMGGLVGLSIQEVGTVIDSYAMVSLTMTGAVPGSTFCEIGGLLGDIEGNAIATRTYSAAPVVTGPSAEDFGFYGEIEGTITFTSNYYYDSATVPSQPTPPAGLTARTTVAAMQLQSNYSGWDFTTVWVMPTANPLSPEGILSPVLRWQCGTNGITCP